VLSKPRRDLVVIAASIRQLVGYPRSYDQGLLRAVMAITKMRF
jgi:hypothetical protein